MALIMYLSLIEHLAEQPAQQLVQIFLLRHIDLHALSRAANTAACALDISARSVTTYLFQICSTWLVQKKLQKMSLRRKSPEWKLYQYIAIPGSNISFWCRFKGDLHTQLLRPVSYEWRGLIDHERLRQDFFCCSLVRELPSMKVGMRYTATAIAALQHAAENYLVDMFEHSNILAVHAKRVTVMPMIFTPSRECPGGSTRRSGGANHLFCYYTCMSPALLCKSTLRTTWQC